MFCNQCEETIQSGCTKGGMCGKSKNVSELQDVLLDQLCAIAASGRRSVKTDLFLVDSLFSTITNVNFDEAWFRARIQEAAAIIGNATLADGQIDGMRKEKLGIYESHEDIASLKLTLLYGIKGISAYAHHASALGLSDAAVNDFIVKALSAIQDQAIQQDRLLSLVMECGSVGVIVMELLDKANTQSFGNPEPGKVRTGVGMRPGILVSGHDLKILDELLKRSEQQGIDIYTHGEMLPANFYPGLKKYPHLFGNYGNSWWHQKEEFEKFNGPILMTTNCLVPVGNAYADRFYSTAVVAYPGIRHISMDDLDQIIEHAKRCAPPQEIDDMQLSGGFGRVSLEKALPQILDLVQQGRIRRFVVMAGCDGRKKERQYYEDFAKALPADTMILTAGCAKYRYNKLGLGEIEGIPRVIDAGQCNDSYSLITLAKKISDIIGTDINALPLSFNIAWYEQKAVLVLLSLLHLGVKNIILGPRLPAFISPGILAVLQKEYGIRRMSDVEKDMAQILS